MRDEEASRTGVHSLTDEQQEALKSWGMRMYSLGESGCTVSDIEKIKYDGRLIILDDGSRWAINSTDADTADSWSMCDKVVVIDDVMYRLEGAEQVDVEEEDD
jgi:hypothetical protein